MSCLTDIETTDYLDGSLPAEHRARVESHLEHCPDCRSIVEDLRSIQLAVRTLEPLVPPPSVWARISTRLEPARQPWHWSELFTWRMLPAAATAAVLVVSLAALGRGLQVTRTENARGPGAGMARVETLTEFELAEAELVRAIAGLEEIAGSERQALDPEMTEVLASNLAAIDGAIDESRTALAAAPESGLVQDTLFDALTDKMALLEDAVALMHDARIDLDGTLETPGSQP